MGWPGLGWSRSGAGPRAAWRLGARRWIAAAAAVSRRDVRLRRRSEAERPGVFASWRADVHRHAVAGVRRWHAGGVRLADVRDSTRRARGHRGGDRRDRDRGERLLGPAHAVGGGGRDGAQLPFVPDGELAHFAVLPRIGHRVHIRLAAVRATRTVVVAWGAALAFVGGGCGGAAPVVRGSRAPARTAGIPRLWRSASRRSSRLRSRHHAPSGCPFSPTTAWSPRAQSGNPT